MKEDEITEYINMFKPALVGLSMDTIIKILYDRKLIGAIVDIEIRNLIYKLMNEE